MCFFFMCLACRIQTVGCLRGGGSSPKANRGKVRTEAGVLRYIAHRIALGRLPDWQAVT